MSPETVDAILAQAVEFTRRLVDTYEAEIAGGEVGVGGSGRATEDPIRGERPPTVLLYGRVQSGKTAAMILTTALCLDNGFRVVIVVTANNVALVQQTADRFRTLDGPRVFSTTGGDVDYEWAGREDTIAADMAADGLVLVCAKDAFHLPQVMEFLQQIDASSHPAIILDDEADAATPDTTLEARTSGRVNAPEFPSTIYRRVVENEAPNEEGQSISEMLPHGLYVQVTATPFIFFLQRLGARIRPTVTHLLEPGEGYCGGELFFAGFNPTAERPAAPIVLVGDTEAQTIPRRAVPRGLAASIDFFLVSAAARAAAGQWPGAGFKHLSHPSVRVQQHGLVARHIERHLDQLRARLRGRIQGATDVFADAYIELRRTVQNPPPLEELMVPIFDAIRQAQVMQVNMQSDVPRYGPRANFLVGGNILGRGLTIDDLLVTYYVREAQTSQMDTVWQHARMYGYRLGLMPYTRVYLPRRLAALFKDIHESEEQLRDIIRRWQEGEQVPVRVARRSRATRRNATEPAALRVFRGDFGQWNPQFLQEDQPTAARIRQRLLDLNVPIDQRGREGRTTRVPIDALLELVDLTPVRPDDRGRWDPDAVRAVIEYYREERGVEMGPVYVRGLRADEEGNERTRGRLGGQEIGIIRNDADGLPTLVLLHLGDSENPRGWYPTLLLPEEGATYIINPL